MFSTSSVLGRGVRKDVMGEEADKGEGEREVCTCPGRQSQSEEVTPHR